MAVWEVRVVYTYGDRHWENVWHLDIGANTDVSSTMVEAFIDFARNTLLSIYSVARIVRRPLGSTDAFIETAVEAAGLIAIGSNFAMPLFNTILVNLLSGAGRPGKKFIRGMLTSHDLVDEQNHIDPTTLGVLQAQLDDLFNTASDETFNFVEGVGDAFVAAGVPSTRVQMRQQHRKRKKTV